MRWVERLIPNLLILWRSVLGCRFRILAAPFGPRQLRRFASAQDMTTLHIFQSRESGRCWAGILVASDFEVAPRFSIFRVFDCGCFGSHPNRVMP
jgi:hypothetical protein